MENTAEVVKISDSFALKSEWFAGMLINLSLPALFLLGGALIFVFSRILRKHKRFNNLSTSGILGLIAVALIFDLVFNFLVIPMYDGNGGGVCLYNFRDLDATINLKYISHSLSRCMTDLYYSMKTGHIFLPAAALICGLLFKWRWVGELPSISGYSYSAFSNIVPPSVIWLAGSGFVLFWSLVFTVVFEKNFGTAGVSSFVTPLVILGYMLGTSLRVSWVSFFKNDSEWLAIYFAKSLFGAAVVLLAFFCAFEPKLLGMLIGDLGGPVFNQAGQFMK